MRRVVTTFILLIVVSCSGHDRVTRVAIVVHIDQPANLSPRSECIALWGNIQRFGSEMDRASAEWNKIVIQSAYELIEKGCVRERQ